MVDVIAVFDIGKTNKKILLFNTSLQLVFQQEGIFEEIKDDDDFPCDDIEKIERWMSNTLQEIVAGNKYNIRAVNFATYGASQVYLDQSGKRLTPVYNYLKPMPAEILDDFYKTYGGVEEFSRKTASPASGMLNSGLQIIWLKKQKPAVFEKVRDIVHFPQYLSYYFTEKIVTEYTYIGCHSSLWDYDQMKYHRWLSDFGIAMREPLESGITFPANVGGKELKIGIGIHDSSASLVPYLSVTKDPFVLLSTGTWFVVMNPFNDEPLTTGQLRSDALSFLSVHKKPVKSSRLFLGYIHQVNAKNISDFFCVEEGFFKKVKTNEAQLKTMMQSEPVFFKNGVPEGYVDQSVDLERFNSAGEAYHQLMVDLVRLAMKSLNLVLAKDDQTKTIYISGGFARNEIFVRLLATLLTGKKVYTSEMDNATALGAALAVWENALGEAVPAADLGLHEILPL
jgi:sugar (pentulose or hexulose) kinase